MSGVLRDMGRLGTLAGIMLCELAAGAQTSPAKAPPSPSVAASAAQGAAVPADAVLDAAQLMIGRALFLRGFYLVNNLSYDAAGHVTGAPKTGEWTLAVMDVKKVERRGPKEIELDGVRADIRYNADNHQFERHAQNDAALKIIVADAGSATEMTMALDAIFSQGIDPRLQQATPSFWQHYFNPALGWPQDALAGQQIYVVNATPSQPGDVVPPVVTHKADAKMTNEAERDRVHGTMQLRMVVDAQGVPQRLAVVRPLGYGLEERAVEAVGKWRFTPAMRQGQPVASALLLNYDFEFVVPPRL
jgi:TonB family protein